VDTAIEWARLTYNPSVDIIARPFKLLANLVVGARARPGATERSASADPGRRLRERSAVVTHGWATVVAIANGAAHRRHTARHVRRGRVVICDRYTLDSVVQLRYLYGHARRYPLQRAVIRALSPAPLRSYLLDVGPDTALARKPEQYSVEQLDRQVGLYRAEGAALGACRVDGESPPERICTEIAQDVWRALA
jgi:thymidylate kinase